MQNLERLQEWDEHWRKTRLDDGLMTITPERDNFSIEFDG
jgi:hypothetical protein